MPKSPARKAGLCLALTCFGLLLAVSVVAKPGLGYRDIMQVRKTQSPVLSKNGEWMAYAAQPDRGDGEGIVRSTSGGKELRVERGDSPQITAGGDWVAFRLQPTFEARETAEEDDAPKPGLVLLRTQDGERWEFERVKSSAFSEDGAWLAIHLEAPEEDPEAEEAVEAEEAAAAAEPAAESGEAEAEEEEREAGTTLVLLHLADQARSEITEVAHYGFDPTSEWIAFTIQTEDGVGNAIKLRSLGSGEVRVVHGADEGAYPVMAWSENLARLAFLAGSEEEPETVTDVALHLWAGSLRTVDAPAEGWKFPSENEFTWTRDDARLFVGLRPSEADENPEEVAKSEEDPPFDPYDFDSILEERELDVWHWDDPRIKTNERLSWKDRSKALFLAVVHFDAARMVPLANLDLPDVRVGQSSRRVLATSSEPYLQLMTWDGFYRDLYAVDLDTGERTQVAVKLQDGMSMSPGGRYVAWFTEGDWWLQDVDTGSKSNITAGLPVSFADEDHDFPRDVPDYGVADWTTDDSALFLYDKYDVWKFPTAGGAAVCLTEGRGRAELRTFRVIDLDPELEGIEPGRELLLSGFHERNKNSSFWRAAADRAGVMKLREDDKRFTFVAKAEEADRILYTEESYTEFPDYWTSDLDLKRARKISDVNPQLENFDLGSAELVEWASADGIPLQGILIKPANYDPKKQYPMLVYFYRFFSQRLHNFNDPVINHRPSFYAYAGDGYAIFLPDIRFEIGRPGLAATKCLVPGVQKVIDMGVADPKGVALHGHSWSGYQAAQIITHTDLFACAVTGAPVSNMTSAYGGIRWGTGLSRQFQYEKSQSRLGVTLWEGRDRYIDNSPLFFADQIETPLLIQFGDEDDAVPWTQGIEFYMAMRRLQKPCVMLQYRGEPHHLKKYPNKLDYSLKMKAFIDHFCKGTPAPDWWTEGVAYEGD